MFSLDCPLALPPRIALPEPLEPAAELPADPPEALPDPVADPLLSGLLDGAEEAPLPLLVGLSVLSCPAAPGVPPLEPLVWDHTRLPLSAIVPLKTIPDKINSFRCISFSPFVSLVALRLQEFVQRICHVCRIIALHSR
jgi:hypothetical protein